MRHRLANVHLLEEVFTGTGHLRGFGQGRFKHVSVSGLSKLQVSREEFASATAPHLETSTGQG